MPTKSCVLPSGPNRWQVRAIVSVQGFEERTTSWYDQADPSFVTELTRITENRAVPISIRWEHRASHHSLPVAARAASGAL